MNIATLETIVRRTLLFIGIAGVLVIYSGFLFLLFSGSPTTALPWFLLISPWICVYYGLTKTQQVAVIHWFSNKCRWPFSSKH